MRSFRTRLADLSVDVLLFHRGEQLLDVVKPGVFRACYELELHAGVRVASGERLVESRGTDDTGEQVGPSFTQIIHTCGWLRTSIATCWTPGP